MDSVTNVSEISEMPKMLASCIAIVFTGKVGSGRSTVMNIMRPWFSTWGYSTITLSIANVMGKGYKCGEICQLRILCEAMRYVDPTYYVKLVCNKVTECNETSIPHVLLVSDISTETELLYLKSVIKNVIVVHVLDSETSVPLAFSNTCIKNIASHCNTNMENDKNCINAETLKDNVSKCFAGTIVPFLKGMMTVDQIKECLIRHAIVTNKITFYDMNLMFSDPNVMFSCMYVIAALVRTKPDLMVANAIVAVSERAVPMAACLAYMLGKKNPSLMFHTHPHDDLVPYDVEWATGTSITGQFAVGWPVHLLPRGSKIILVDDIYSTGQRSKVVRKLAESNGYVVNGTCVLFKLESECNAKNVTKAAESTDKTQSVISLIDL